MNRHKSGVALRVVMAGILVAGALQAGAAVNSANYAFNTATNGTFTDMSSGTTQLIGPITDDSPSGVTNIGFDFYFMGTRYTQFSASSNGYIRLGGTAVSGIQFALGTAGAPLITALGSDLIVSSTGMVHYKVTGTAPNRVLTVEFRNMTIIYDGIGASANGTDQVRLHETTGVIEFLYGPMNRNSSTGFNGGMNPQYIGFSTNNTTGNFATIDTANNENTATPVAANQFPLGAPMASLNSPIEGMRRIYTFAPPVPAAPTNLTFTGITPLAMTLNWTDSPNEQFYAIFNSTDGTNFAFVGTAAQDATSLNATELSPSTTYFWRVFAVSEGGLSAVLAGNQATTAGGNITSTAAGGNWSSAATWVGGVLPSSSDNVTIADGATVTINTTAFALSLSVGTGGTPATLQWDPGTARILSVGTSVTIAANGTFRSAITGTITTHALTVGTNLTNNGVLDFSTNSNTAGANITFTGAASKTFGGTGATTDIRTLTINKGTSSASVLELNPSNFTVQGVNTDVAGFLTLTNGTLKTSGTFTMANRVFTIPTYTIPATSGIWLNNPNFTVSGQAGDVICVNNGLFRVTQGTYNIGVGAADGMGGGNGAVFIVEGGTINASGRIDPQTAVSYTQTGGTVNVATVGNTRTNFGSFELFNEDSSFTMSGGTINLINRNTGATQIDCRVFSGMTNVTGGLLVVGATGAPSGTNYQVQGTTPDITINPTMTLAASSASSGFALLMRGTTVLNNGAIISSGTGARFDFAGDAPMSYSGPGTFGTTATPFDANGISSNSTSPVTLNSPIVTYQVNLFRGGFIHSNQITLGNGGASATVVNIGAALLFTSGGSFDVSPNHQQGTGGETVNYMYEPTPRTTGVEINPTRVLNAMQVDNPNNVTIAGGDLTISSASDALTLINGRIITGNNTLALSSGTAVVSRTNGFVDGNLKKTFTFLGSKTFEVGTSTGYSPATINVTNGLAPAADITVRANPGRQPNYAGITALKRYWTITTPASLTADLTFQYLAGDVVGNESAYKVVRYSSGFTAPASSVNTGTHVGTVSSASPIGGDWTLLEMDTDFDGMPDSYESTHGLNPNDPSDANTDLDGDGQTNLAEYLAGTNPQDANSVLRITATARNGSGFVVSFPAIAGMTYRLEYKNVLTDPTWMSLPMPDFTAASTGTAQITDSSAVGQTKRFYHIRVVLP